MALDHSLNNGQTNATTFEFTLGMQTVKTPNKFNAYCISNPAPLSEIEYNTSPAIFQLFTLITGCSLCEKI